MLSVILCKSVAMAKCLMTYVDVFTVEDGFAESVLNAEDRYSEFLRRVPASDLMLSMKL
jgi:hypothetical protein